MNRAILPLILLPLLASCGGGGDTAGSTQAANSASAPTGIGPVGDPAPGASTGGSSTSGDNGKDPAAANSRWTYVMVLADLYGNHGTVDFSDSGELVGSDLVPSKSFPPPYVPRIQPYIGKAGQPTTKLGTLDWDSAEVSAGNNQGQLVGTGTTYIWEADGVRLDKPASISTSFLYDHGHITTLPLGASRINDVGDIAGTSAVPSSDGTVRSLGFVLSNGIKTDIRPLPGRSSNTVIDINDVGAVTGYSEGSGPPTAFFYRDGQATDLGALPGYASSCPKDINAAGHIVGAVSNGNRCLPWNNYDEASRPFLYADGALQELPTLGRKNGVATSINNAGQIVGTLYDGLGPTDLENATGVLYSGGKALDLNTIPAVVDSGWKIIRAYKINNAGQILVVGQNDPTTRNFVLAPVPF